MSFCPSCGAKAAEGSKFCEYCGTPLSTQTQTQQPPVQPSEQPVYSYAPHPVAPATPAIGLIKKIASSPLFLVAAIAFSLTIVLQLINSLSVSSYPDKIVSILYQLAYEFDSYELMDALNQFTYYIDSNLLTLSSGVGAFTGMIPTIIVAIGLWLTFAAGANKKVSTFSTTGITVVKVMNMITLVFTCIGFGLGAIGLLIATIVLAAASSEVAVLIVLSIVFIIFVIVGIFNIIYYSKINKTLKAVKQTALGTNPSPYASRFVGVICWISAILGLFGVITAFGFAGKLAVLSTSVATACFGALIFSYRSKMNALAATPVTIPEYAAPSAAPASAPTDPALVESSDGSLGE